MAGGGQAYPFLAAIKDPMVQQALRHLFDQVAGLKSGNVARENGIDMGGQTLSNVGDAVGVDDAVSSSFADKTYGPTATRPQLEAGGTAPLNVAGLMGVLTQPQKMGIQIIPDTDLALPDAQLVQDGEVVTWKGILYYFDGLTTNPGKWVPLSAAASLLSDTHANRLTTFLPAAQPANILFYETDRNTIYRNVLSAGVKTWTYLVGLMRGTLPLDPADSLATDQRPTDLGAADTGFRYEGTNISDHYRWTGGGWNLEPYEFPRENLVRNQSFEWYETWDATSGTPVVDPTYWTKGGGITSAVRSTSNVYDGTYSVAVTSGGGDFYQDVFPTVSGTVNVVVRGQTVTASALIAAGAAGRVFLFLDDGAGSTTSPAHSGSGGNELLIVSRPISGAATRLRVGLRISGGGAITVTIDDVQALFGPVPGRTRYGHPNDWHVYPFRAKVHNSVNQSIVNAAITTLTFDTEDYDKGELHSTTVNTSRLTLPVGGGGVPSLWVIGAQVRYDVSVGAGQVRLIRILRNGAKAAQVEHRSINNGTDPTDLQATYVAMDPADGDYFEIQVYQDSGGALNVIAGASETVFYAYRVI